MKRAALARTDGSSVWFPGIDFSNVFIPAADLTIRALL